MTNNPPSAQITGQYGFPLKLKARYDNFIGGEWVAPASGITRIYAGDRAAAVRSGVFGQTRHRSGAGCWHKVKDKWAHTSVQDRAAILFKYCRSNGTKP